MVRGKKVVLNARVREFDKMQKSIKAGLQAVVDEKYGAFLDNRLLSMKNMEPSLRKWRLVRCLIEEE